MKTLLKAGLVAAFALTAPAAFAAGAAKFDDFKFSFDGAFGSFDQAQLQRGFQVYKEVCASCHGLKFVAFRTLADKNGPGLDADTVKAVAAEYEFPSEDDPDELVPGKPFNYFPEITSADAPDLSLMAKARAHGPDYIKALLEGYEDAPDCAPEDFDGNYNSVFAAGGFPDECKYQDDPKHEDGEHMVPGSWIAMGQPLYGEDVEFADGTIASVEQQSEDVTAFLAWASEPHMVERKQAGIWSIGFLIIFAVLLWFTNKKVWSRVKGH